MLRSVGKQSGESVESVGKKKWKATMQCKGIIRSLWGTIVSQLVSKAPLSIAAMSDF